jgi:hypothetical protein
MATNDYTNDRQDNKDHRRPLGQAAALGLDSTSPADERRRKRHNGAGDEKGQIELPAQREPYRSNVPPCIRKNEAQRYREHKDTRQDNGESHASRPAQIDTI